ncbi:hypothetical protein F511_25866 [Dorcoceras hygrometricum]|uniref:Uncharacterized protein n=1 Tax=Dorcoceras hygrometricum TaxID=472368 RepID=A0A2Z7B102_9LAMI|nr:hypothetical protein F511_25866 [Dorcoceras hygrometricum]
MTFRVVRTNQYNQDLGLIHSTNGNHLESPNEGSSIDHQPHIACGARPRAAAICAEHGARCANCRATICAPSSPRRPSSLAAQGRALPHVRPVSRPVSRLVAAQQVAPISAHGRAPAAPSCATSARGSGHVLAAMCATACAHQQQILAGHWASSARPREHNRARMMGRRTRQRPAASIPKTFVSQFGKSRLDTIMATIILKDPSLSSDTTVGIAVADPDPEVKLPKILLKCSTHLAQFPCGNHESSTCVTLNGSEIQLAVGPQPLRLRNHNFGLAQWIMVKRLATSPHDPLGITDSACKNQLVVVSVQYGPFNPYIPIRSTTIDKSRVVIDPIAMHTSWRSNSDIASPSAELSMQTPMTEIIALDQYAAISTYLNAVVLTNPNAVVSTYLNVVVLTNPNAVVL